MVLANSHKVSPASCYSGYQPPSSIYMYGTFTPYGYVFQSYSISLIIVFVGPSTPHKIAPMWFGLFRVRSPLLAESLLFSSPPGTEMFQFPGFPSRFNRDILTSSVQVFPFGHLRINVCLQLPVAFRSLPRPSSSPGA